MRSPYPYASPYVVNVAKIRVGEKAPEFELLNQREERVSLSSLHGHPLIVYFYPRDFTLVCTREACQFRDANTEWEDLGVTVLGISRDSTRSHARFASKHDLKFHLLSDRDGSVHELYGVRVGPLGSQRVTFVVDAHGLVRARHQGRLQAKAHIDAARRALKEMAEQPGTVPETPGAGDHRDKTLQ